MKALLLNSGGLDTLAVAKLCSEQGYELHSCYVDLGQKNNTIAQESAQRIADKFCVSHKVLVVEGARPKYYTDYKMYGVPFQSCIVFVLAAHEAAHLGCEYIISGLKSDAAHGDFNEKFLAFLKTSKIIPAVIPLRPIATWTMDQIKELLKDEPLMNLTVSCNQDPKCGVCGKCVQRGDGTSIEISTP